MKFRWLPLCVVLLLVGCTTVAPKDQIQSIFQKIKAGEKKNAVRVYQGDQSETFGVLKQNHSGLRRETVRRLMSTASTYINGCEALIRELEGSKLLKGDPKEVKKHLEEQLPVQARNFKRECELEGSEWKEKQLISIKAYSGIEFLDRRAKWKAKFYPEVQRLKAEIKSWEAAVAKKKADKEAEEIKRQNSPEYYEQKLCEITGILSQAKIRIRQENEAAKHSGVVNKPVLYRNGQRVQAFLEQLEWVSAEYKEKFGKSWSGKCN